MSNGDPNEPRRPIIPRTPVPFTPIFPEPSERERERRLGQRRRAGLPATPILVPPVQPATPSPPVRLPLPTGPAANDPVFSRALPFIRVGAFVVGVASALDLLIRAIQEEEINRRQREREEVDKLVSRKLGSDNPLRVVEISAPLDQPATPFEFEIGDVPLTPRAPPTRAPEPRFEPLEIPPVVAPPATPKPPEIPAPPRELPAITPRPESPAAPSSAPLPVGTPGIGTPTPVFVPGTPGLFSTPAFPGIFSPPLFVSPPVTSPTFAPRVGTPLTPTRSPDVPSSTQPGTLQLPQQQPQPQNRRCPQQKRKRKKKRKRRDECFKGLYREGPFDDQISFTKFAKIDCSSGRELGKRRRPSGPPELRIVRRVVRAVKKRTGG